MLKLFTKPKQNQVEQTDKGRSNCYLPRLSFVVEDQWEDVIGEKAYRAWRKLYTKCDRKKTENNIAYYCKYFNVGSIDEINLWEQAVIRWSITRLHEEIKDVLRCGAISRFYKDVIKPLWNVGLIDIVEWEESHLKGQKPKNIIVYAYPQNDKSLRGKPLAKVRDYDSDYNSEARIYALMGVKKTKKRSKKVQSPKKSEAELYTEYMDSLTSVEECIESYPQIPVDNSPVDIVDELNDMDFAKENVENNVPDNSDNVSPTKMTGNNIINTFTNNINNINTSYYNNNHNHNKHNNCNKGEKWKFKFDVDENERQLINQSKIFHFLFERLKDYGIHPKNHMPIACALWNLGIKSMEVHDIKQSLENVIAQKKKGKTFTSIKSYIVATIYKAVTNSVLPTATATDRKQREQKKWESPVGQAVSGSSGLKSYVFYDWL